MRAISSLAAQILPQVSRTSDSRPFELFYFFGLIKILVLLFFNYLWICSSNLKSDHFDNQYILG